MNDRTIQNLFPVGAIFVLLAAILKLSEVVYVEYIFSLGALLLIAYHGLVAYNQTNTDSRIQRLYRIGFLSSLFLAVAAYFMFTSSNSWIVMVLIYAVNTFYLSYRTK
jgi:hypothetical protein